MTAVLVSEPVTGTLAGALAVVALISGRRMLRTAGMAARLGRGAERGAPSAGGGRIANRVRAGAPRAALAIGSGVLCGMVIGLPRAMIMAILGIVGLWARRAQLTRQAEGALSRDLPEIFEVIGGALRSGGTFLDGLRAASALPFEPTTRRDMKRVMAEIDRGGQVAEALDAWAGRSEDVDLRTLAGLVESATGTGGPLAAALDRLSAAIRQRHAQRREVDALVGQARLSAMVLVVLPFAVLPLLDAFGTVDLTTIVADPISRVAITLGLVLDISGLAWMRRLIGRIDG